MEGQKSGIPWRPKTPPAPPLTDHSAGPRKPTFSEVLRLPPPASDLKRSVQPQFQLTDNDEDWPSLGTSRNAGCRERATHQSERQTHKRKSNAAASLESSRPTVSEICDPNEGNHESSQYSETLCKLKMTVTCESASSGVLVTAETEKGDSLQEVPQFPSPAQSQSQQLKENGLKTGSSKKKRKGQPQPRLNVSNHEFGLSKFRINHISHDHCMVSYP